MRGLAELPLHGPQPASPHRPAVGDPAPAPVASGTAPGDAAADKPAGTNAPRRPPRKESAPVAPPAAGPGEPAAPTTATLRVLSDVPGAQVFLNREFVG